MAREFFELWQEASVFKKIVAVLGIAGVIAASIASIFSLKDSVAEKEKISGSNGSIIVSGNGNAVGPNATINNSSHNPVLLMQTISKEGKK